MRNPEKRGRNAGDAKAAARQRSRRRNPGSRPRAAADHAAAQTSVTTHVLNTAAGQPAAGVPITLEFDDGGEWRSIARTLSDPDGRAHMAAPGAGLYCLCFDTARISAFFPEIRICFQIDDPSRHYHVPLLLSPHGYTTYRGS